MDTNRQAELARERVELTEAIELANQRIELLQHDLREAIIGHLSEPE